MRTSSVRFDEVYGDLCKRYRSETGLFRSRWKKVKLEKDRRVNVSPAEWRRFRTEISLALAQNPGDDETAVREHVLMQLPLPWKTAAVQKELQIRNHTRAVRVWVLEGETVHSLWNDLQGEVDGLVLRDSDSRSFRVNCPSKEVQEKLLRFNGFFVDDILIKVTTSEIPCTVADICEMMAERVEEMEELEALAPYSVSSVQAVG